MHCTSSSGGSSSSWRRLRVPELRNSNEISGKVNILCVNQILANIRERKREREDRWQGASKLNKSVTREYNLVLRLSSLFIYIYICVFRSFPFRSFLRYFHSFVEYIRWDIYRLESLEFENVSDGGS